MHLNLLLQATPNPFFPGLWRSPEDDSSLGYRSLEFWRHLATAVEGAHFDAVLFERTDAVPRFDPMMVVANLAGATSNLGLVTSPDAAQLPAAIVAEQLSTLDHISNGRIGWRIDDVAEDQLRAAIALWETSWRQGAMVFDTQKNTMYRQDRVQPADGLGIHPCEPTRQRTPTLFAQADVPNGPRFAEVLMVDPVPVDQASQTVEAILDDVDAADRSFDEVKLVMTARIIVGADEAQVTRRKRHIDRYGGEGTAASAPFVGTAAEVADQMEQYLACGLHGFSLATAPLPGGVDVMVTELVPHLRERGLLRSRYEATTLREHYFGFDETELPPDHPARSR